MMFLGILALSTIMTWFWYKNKNAVFTAVAMATWVILMIYTRANPVPGMTTGSTGDGIIVILCVAMTIALPVIAYQTRKGNAGLFADVSDNFSERRDSLINRNARNHSGVESYDDYKARMHRLARGRRG